MSTLENEDYHRMKDRIMSYRTPIADESINNRILEFVYGGPLRRF